MDHSEPPSWVRETFGALAEELAIVVPQAIRAAHERAMGSHLGGDMRSADAYGSTLWVAQFEELIKATRDINGVKVSKPEGVSSRFGLAMVGERKVALYPWRYARDGSTRREDARLTRRSMLRTSLLTLPSGPVAQQLSLDEHASVSETELEAFFAEEQLMREQVQALGSVVTVGYASNCVGPGAVFNVGWGFAELTDEEAGTMVWHTWQPLNPVGDAGDIARPILGIVESSERRKRFDDAPLDDGFDLTARVDDGSVPTSEPVRKSDDAGSLDE